MYDLLTDVATPVMGVSLLMKLWGGIWPYLLMLAGFSLIIFVHELGHFAVAKWAGCARGAVRHRIRA